MSHTKANLNGLILAGGFSKRMGQDKALLQFHGKNQIEYTHQLLEPFVDRLFLSKRSDQKSYSNIDFIDDDPDFANHGPLCGILSAMKQFPHASWIILACDLPFVTSQTIETLITQRNPNKIATAFISSSDQLPEPLCAIWEGHAFETIVKFFHNGIYCPRKILIKSIAHLITQSNPRWLDNVNTPEDFQSAKNLL